jgi:hypothetical protein
MAVDLLETFRVLSSFAPARRSLADAPWEQYVDWAISQGLAPLAAYNLEYRLAGADAPEWARDRLLSIYQGSLNDNVMKLVNFKRAIDGLEGHRVLLIGGGSFAESLYPHVAFRPLLDIRLVAPPSDLEHISAVLQEREFRPEPTTDSRAGTAKVLSDGRTQILLYSELLGPSRLREEAALFERALPMPVFGPSAFRLDLEDALLVACLEQARAGYEVPLLWFVDLRELLTGAAAVSGPYSRACDFAQLKDRAARWGVERAVYASLSLVERFFPETESQARLAKPDLRRVIRVLLERWVVDPLAELPRIRAFRGSDRLRRLLAVGL